MLFFLESEVELLRLILKEVRLNYFNRGRSYLDKKVKMMSSEVHQEFVMEELVSTMLKEQGFKVYKHGEITIGINSRHLNHIRE